MSIRQADLPSEPSEPSETALELQKHSDTSSDAYPAKRQSVRQASDDICRSEPDLTLLTLLTLLLDRKAPDMTRSDCLPVCIEYLNLSVTSGFTPAASLSEVLLTRCIDTVADDLIARSATVVLLGTIGLEPQWSDRPCCHTAPGAALLWPDLVVLGALIADDPVIDVPIVRGSLVWRRADGRSIALFKGVAP